MVEAITLGEKEVLLAHRDLDINKVRLDPNNARIQFLTADVDGPLTQQVLEELLWDIDDVHKLMAAVKRNGGLVERIIVRSDGTAVEGNCRTVVYRKLHGLDPAEHRWSAIPARVLPSDVTQQQVDILLGELHIAGKNKWTAFEKAGYVYRMNKIFGWSQDALAELLRSSKASINQMVRAYALMKEKFLPKYQHEVKDPELKYSYFLEFYKKMRDRADDYDEQFVEWVGTGKLTKGSDVRDLLDIVNSESAFKSFKANGFEAAKGVLAQDNPARSSRLFATVDRMIDELRSARADEISSLRGGEPAKQRKIKELYEAVLTFAEMSHVTLDSGKRIKSALSSKTQ